jgi:hypothetical protein
MEMISNLAEIVLNIWIYKMNFDDNKRCDEFFWECEFRKDDARIHSCMQEIPAVIDLPEEDELLQKRLLKQPEYAKNINTTYDDFGLEVFLDFEDILFPDNWRERDGASLYGDIEQLMKEWSVLYASKLDDNQSNNTGIRILCLYGKIMGFSIDLVDVGEDKMPGLKIALCKRILGGINQIAAFLKILDNGSDYILQHRAALNGLRDKVLGLRFKLKNEADTN